MDVSIILCTYNNCLILEQTLNNFQKSHFSDQLQIEMLVVDNHSRDKTELVVQKYLCVLPIKYIFEKTSGKSSALNTGLRYSKGEYIIFADDDISPPVDWINDYWSAYKKHGNRYFYGGSIYSQYEGDAPDPRLVPYAPFSVKGLNFGEKSRELSGEECFVGANWACPKNFLLQAGGFDTSKGINYVKRKSSVGEETHLMNKLVSMGYVPLYLPEVGVKHYVPKNKCTKAHILSRIEASAYNNAYDQAHDFKGARIAGIPRWMFRKYLEAVSQYIGAVVKRKDTLDAIVNIRRATGLLRGAWACKNNKKSSPSIRNVAYLIEIFPKISETFILNEMLEAQRQGISVTLFSLKNSNDSIVHESVSELKKVVYLSSRGGWRKIWDHVCLLGRYPWGYIRAFFRALEPSNGLWDCFWYHGHEAREVIKHKPDHIHVHFCMKASDLALLIRLVSGIPFSFTTHRYDIYEFEHKNLAFKSRNSVKHIAISNINKEYLTKRFHVSPRDIEIVRCGIDIRQFPVPKDSNREDILLNVGRLEPIKAHNKLLEMVEVLKRENVRIKTVIIGDGTERTHLEGAIKKRRLDGECVLLGAQTQNFVAEYYKKARIFVLTSLMEGIPVSLMEAMIFGVPVVSSDVGSVSELVEHGKNGYLYPFGDIETLAGYIKELITNEPLRQKFITAAYERVRSEFDLAAETRKLIDIWKS